MRESTSKEEPAAEGKTTQLSLATESKRSEEVSCKTANEESGLLPGSLAAVFV
jgi:hypothetical protein